MTTSLARALAALALILAAACGGTSTPTAQPAPPPADAPTTQLANPASVYCTEIGGTLEIRDEEGGQAGYCTKDGQTCDEWKLFRGECPELAPASPAAGE